MPKPRPRYSRSKDTVDVRREDVRSLLYLIIIAVFLGTLMVMLPGSTADKKITLEEQVLQELSQHDEIKPYLNSETQVIFLPADELARLSNEQPAIYAGVPDGSYQVTYKPKQGPGLLAIYNPESKEIVKLFAVEDFVI